MSTSGQRAPMHTFISYSHEDESLRIELEKHLATMIRGGLLTVWTAPKLLGGDDFNAIIAQEINKADLVLLLVSPSFLASNYCYDVELPLAMKRRAAGLAKVVPIIIRPCYWQSDPAFGNLHALPPGAKPVTSWSDRDAAWVGVVDGIRALVKRP